MKIKMHQKETVPLFIPSWVYIYAWYLYLKKNWNKFEILLKDMVKMLDESNTEIVSPIWVAEESFKMKQSVLLQI